MKKDVKQLIKQLLRNGYTVRMTRKCHWQVSRHGQFVTVLPGTPSDWRSYQNALAALRRTGFNPA